MRVTRIYKFSASHRLHAPTFSDAENQRLYGKCNHPFGHGHDYVLHVSIDGQPDQQTGVIVPIPKLDQMMSVEILNEMDHSNLNVDIAEFATLVPTTENIALLIADRLARAWPRYFPRSNAALSRIFIAETDRNYFEVLIPQDAALASRTLESVTVNA
jgi:6-pyruvoyltetrahydropterin/6-carboxytetrahydropterin synthase